MNSKSAARIKGLMGLCRKSGHSGSGEFQCIEAIRRGEAKLTLLAVDASDNTRKRFHDKCSYYQVPVIDTPFTKTEIGQAIGQGERSCIVVCEEGLAALIRKAFEVNNQEVNL